MLLFQSEVQNTKLYLTCVKHIPQLSQSTEEHKSKPARSDTFLERLRFLSQAQDLTSKGRNVFHFLRLILMLQRVLGISSNKSAVLSKIVFFLVLCKTL